MKKTLLGFMIATMSIFTIGCTKQQEAPKEEITAPTQTEVVETETKPKPKVTEERGGVTTEVKKEELVLKILQDNYEENSTVIFDKNSKTYTIIPFSEGLAREVLRATEGSAKHIDAWNKLVQTNQEASLLLTDALGKGYSLALGNPVNTDNTLLLVQDGNVIYDCVADGNF